MSTNYFPRAETLASELKELQGELADYNAVSITVFNISHGGMTQYSEQCLVMVKVVN